MKVSHLKKSVWQKQLGHCLDSSTVPRIFHFRSCKQMFISRSKTMQVKKEEQSTSNFDKDRTVLSLPFRNRQKSVSQKQKSIIQDNR